MSLIPTMHTEQLVPVDSDHSVGLVETFHEATKYFPGSYHEAVPDITAFLTNPTFIDRSLRGYNANPFFETIQLKGGGSSLPPMAEVFSQRRSVREFYKKPMGLETIGQILHHAAGVTRTARVDGQKKDASFRSYPSGGGLFPVELYIVPLAVPELPPCVAHYLPRSHALELVRRTIRPDEFSSALIRGPAIENAAFAVILTGVLQRSLLKYGARGYRFALLEAGHAGQNLCLAATASGFGSLLWDDESNSGLRAGHGSVIQRLR